MAQDILQQLAFTIAERRSAEPGSSYTQQLLSKGTLKCAQKMGEEAVELALAAIAEDDDAVAGEAADLLFHVLVLLEAREISLNSVLERLEARRGTSGFAEKARRKAKVE